MSTHTHLYIIHVDYGSCDVREQVNELLLEEPDTFRDLIDDELHSLVVSQNVDAHQCHVAMPCQVACQHFHHKIARVVGSEQVERFDHTIHLP